MPQKSTAKKTSDLKMPTKQDGSKDKRYSMPQFTKSDGSRDKRTVVSSKKK
jgi:hypothetical protein